MSIKGKEALISQSACSRVQLEVPYHKTAIFSTLVVRCLPSPNTILKSSPQSTTQQEEKVFLFAPECTTTIGSNSDSQDRKDKAEYSSVVRVGRTFRQTLFTLIHLSLWCLFVCCCCVRAHPSTTSPELILLYSRAHAPTDRRPADIYRRADTPTRRPTS